jgi:hypothetical protein
MERHQQATDRILLFGLFSFLFIEFSIASSGADDRSDAGPFLQMIGVLAAYVFLFALLTYFGGRPSRRYSELAQKRAPRRAPESAEPEEIESFSLAPKGQAPLESSDTIALSDKAGHRFVMRSGDQQQWQKEMRRERLKKAIDVLLVVLALLGTMLGLGFLGDWIRPLFREWLGPLAGLGFGLAVTALAGTLIGFWAFCARIIRRSQSACRG